jgi:transposase
VKERRKYSETQRKQIRHWKGKIDNIRLYKKLEVLDYASKGYTNKEISELTDYSRSRISELLSEYEKNGIEYFIEEQRKGGNHRNLTIEQEKKILSKFEERAIAGKVVTINEIKAEYEKVRGKETANSTFYSFLERMEWRRVMPRGAHPKKADDEAINASKKLTPR